MAECQEVVPLVKICGLTRAEDALAAARAGADLLGIVFARNSKRRVDEGAAKKIVSFVRGWYEHRNARRAQTVQCGQADQLECPRFVGVWIDESVDVMNRITESVGLDLIQLHGDEVPELLPQLARPVIRAVRIDESVPDIVPWRDAEWLLFDSATGGSGQTFEWAVLRGIDRPFLLAGGLTAGNVAAAIHTTGARGVDVASGVESSPGVKDSDMLRTFIDMAKGAGS